MIDTHCHLYSEYYENLDEIIENIKEAGIEKVIVNGCDLNSNKEVLELVNKYDIVYGAIGFHPTEMHDSIDECMDFLEHHVNDKKIVAIGEIGLDYHYDDIDKYKQNILFKRQLEIADKYNKPVIIHSRDSIQDTYELLSQFKVRGVIHAYSGSLEMAKKFIKLGFYLGIGGVCTFKNAKNILLVIENVDLAYILLETDSPYLTPVPFRGQMNTPAYIPIIVSKIAEIKNVSDNYVVDVTNNNAYRLFDF